MFFQQVSTNMPTSSQANILRVGDSNQRPQVSYRCDPSEDGKIGFKDEAVKYAKTSPTKEACELVKFDFNMSTSPNHSLNGFEGEFAFDQKTKSYRWRIFSISPKTRSDATNKHDQNSGDFIEQINRDGLTGGTIEHENINESNSFITTQSSEHTRHFTTPAVSLLDNSSYAADQKQLKFRSKNALMTSLNIPPDVDLLDGASYRRLEELGFRRRTTYSPGGSLVRINHGESPLKSPQKCSSFPSDGATITINTMDPTYVPKPRAIPYKNQGFQPKPCVRGDSMRKRIRPKKQKSLLDEVKETVQWDKRVAPGTHLSHGQTRHMPTTACFTLKDAGYYSHLQVKVIVEQQTKCQVKTLRYDPVPIRMSDAGCTGRWIVTFTSKATCMDAVETGLCVEGLNVDIRAWDDIVREEQATGWEYPCSYRLKSETDKHNLVLRNFLSVH